MADSVGTNGAVVGAISTVCTVLLGAAGLNLKQLSSHNAALVARIERRDKDVDSLNAQLLAQGEELGALRSLPVELERLRAENADLQRLLRSEDERGDDLRLQVERLTLEKIGLKHRLESLDKS